jgi:hypothetical protein
MKLLTNNFCTSGSFRCLGGDNSISWRTYFNRKLKFVRRGSIDTVLIYRIMTVSRFSIEMNCPAGVRCKSEPTQLFIITFFLSSRYIGNFIIGFQVRECCIRQVFDRKLEVI